MESTNSQPDNRKDVSGGARAQSGVGTSRARNAFVRQSGPAPWRETLVSIAATCVLFAAAIVSMTSVLVRERSRAEDLDASSRTRVTFLQPPRPTIPMPGLPEEAKRKPRPTKRATEAPEAAPTVTSPLAPTPVDTSARATAPAPSLFPPTNLRTITSPQPAAAPERSTAAPTGVAGAPAAPAGVTVESRAARGMATMTPRDSAFAAWNEQAHDLARWQTMSVDAKNTTAASGREIARLAERAGTAGNSSDVHVPTGQGMDGVGAAGGLISIPFPLFSSGPSRAQRVRDSVIDADVRAGLARLAARARAKHDSLRVIALRDSLRADSLRSLSQRADSLHADSVRRLARRRP